jgi:hypothetical protein
MRICTQETVEIVAPGSDSAAPLLSPTVMSRATRRNTRVASERLRLGEDAGVPAREHVMTSISRLFFGGVAILGATGCAMAQEKAAPPQAHPLRGVLTS